jgi:hypothetical protein
MRVVIDIPEASIEKSKWLPSGISLIRVPESPATGFSNESHFFVRDEWITKGEIPLAPEPQA